MLTRCDEQGTSAWLVSSSRRNLSLYRRLSGTPGPSSCPAALPVGDAPAPGPSDGAAEPRRRVGGILTAVSDDSQKTPSPAERDTTSVDPGHHSGAVERARADLAAGRAWKARDRLTGFLRDEYDPEALELLGEVHHTMGDLPAAGAAWFGTSRRGHDVDESIEAWRSGTPTTSPRCGAACPGPSGKGQATSGWRRCADAPSRPALRRARSASAPRWTPGRAAADRRGRRHRRHPGGALRRVRDRGCRDRAALDRAGVSTAPTATAERRRLLTEVAARVPAPAGDSCVRVGIDGVDGSGKTVFAGELSAVLREAGRQVVQVSVDDFHHVRALRYRRGRSRPRGSGWTPSTTSASSPRCSGRSARRVAGLPAAGA